MRATLPHSEAPPSMGPDGLIRIWLDPKVADELGRARSPGESYSDAVVVGGFQAGPPMPQGRVLNP